MLMYQCYRLNHLPSAAGDSIYGADNQEIPVWAGCPRRLGTAFFKVIIYQFTPVISSVVETFFSWTMYESSDELTKGGKHKGAAHKSLIINT